MAEIASEIGLSSTAISNIARNQIKQLTLVTGAKIIAAMQRRGFPMQVSDLIAYRPADGEQDLRGYRNTEAVGQLTTNTDTCANL
jgi:DNA-binding Xre family transcriptional regulator